MQACQDYTTKGIAVVSPHDRPTSTYSDNIQRSKWKEWANNVNEEAKEAREGKDPSN